MPIDEEQKAHKQHAVPQNIMDVEFKLIGDLTMRQFSYLMVFGLLGYLSILAKAGIFSTILFLFFVLLGLALAFVPIQERGMDEWLANFVRAMYLPTQRVWKKEPILPAAFTYQNLALVKQELITLAPTSSRRKLEEYLEVQHKVVLEDKLDIPERDYILKVRQAFAPVGVTGDTRMDDDSKIRPQLQYEAPIPGNQVFVESEKTQQEVKAPIKSTPGASTTTPEQPLIMDVKPPEKKKDQTVPRPKHEPKPLSLPQKRSTDELMLSPLTPDRHSGRRFTRVLPAEGQLVLPVRGEKVLQTSEEMDIQKDIDEKTDQLRKLLDQIKQDTGVSPVTKQPPPEDKNKKPEIDEAQTVVKKVKEENEKLSNEIAKLKKEIEVSQVSELEKKEKREQLEKLEKEQKSATSDYNSLQRQVLELQKRLKEKETPANAGPKNPIFAKMAPITTDPNIVSGVVKNNNGDAVAGVVLLIKNNKGESVRALKTNQIGQFSISTPLVNGMYTLEVGSGIEGQIFDIITIEVKGEVIPPIEFTGRKA